MLNESSFIYNETFELESGAALPQIQLRYHTYGRLNEDRSNIIWVCHALTANSEITDWWAGLFGKGKLYDPENYFVICANMLGGCYGSTGPLSENPESKETYFHNFPLLTNRDIARAFDLLRVDLGFHKIHTIVGASLGGQQALEWAIQKSTVFQHLIVMGTNAQHSPWGIAFNETQRMAIDQDPTWKTSTKTSGLEGLKTARAIALLSYRNYETYSRFQQEKDGDNSKINDFRPSSYQRYQGEKLVKRFDAFSYWTLSKAMDSQNLGRNRGGNEQALAMIKAKTMVVGLKTDILFPIDEQKYLNEHIGDSQYVELDSIFGHDGFLIETDELTDLIHQFYS